MNWEEKSRCTFSSYRSSICPGSRGRCHNSPAAEYSPHHSPLTWKSSSRSSIFTFSQSHMSPHFVSPTFRVPYSLKSHRTLGRFFREPCGSPELCSVHCIRVSWKRGSFPHISRPSFLFSFMFLFVLSSHGCELPRTSSPVCALQTRTYTCTHPECTYMAQMSNSCSFRR